VYLYMGEGVTVHVPGACVAFGDRGVLLMGPGSIAWARALVGSGEARLIADESVQLRLALILLDDPRFFVPHTVLDDFGQKHSGAAAFAWLAQNTYSQPRADVFGEWAEGGEDQVFARDVDAESSPVVLAYPPSPPVPLSPSLGRGAGGEGAPVRVVAAFMLSAAGPAALTPTADLGLPQPMSSALREYDLNTTQLDPADPEARCLLRDMARRIERGA